MKKLLPAALCLVASCAPSEEPQVTGGSENPEKNVKDDRGGGQAVMAKQIVVQKPADDAMFLTPSVEVMESQPVQFAINCKKQTPTPGVKVTVEAIGKPDADNVIEVKLLQKMPGGVGLTVMDSVDLRIPLGSLKPGTYSLRFLVRDAADGKHEAKGSLAFEAK